jgi:hypothetical protein
MLSSKSTKAEVTDRFQDGSRRHVGNSSARYKMGNYHPSEFKSRKSGNLRQNEQQKLNTRNDVV